MDFMMGVFGAIFALLLFIGGMYAGYELRGKLDARPAVRAEKEAGEAEKKRAKAEREAFVQMQSYDESVVYGGAPKPKKESEDA